MTPKQHILTRKWQRIHKTKTAMEELVLKLMENPATEPEHLAQAHTMYAGVCSSLAEISHHVSNALRTGTTVAEVEKTTCSCGYEGSRVKGEAYRCPACGMY